MELQNSRGWRAALLVICCLPVLITLLYIRTYAVEFPLLDDWDVAIEKLQRLETHSLTWSDLNVQHTESIILFPQALALGIAKVAGYHVVYSIYASYLFQCGSLLLLFQFFRWLGLRGRWSVLCFLPVSIFFLSWRQSEGLLWGIHLLNTMVLFFSLLALYGCLRAVDSYRYFVLAIAAGWIASFSMASGLLVWVVGGVYLAAMGRWRYTAAWILSGVVCGACFVADRVSYSEDWPTGVGYVLSRPLAAAAYGLTYLGSPFTRDPVAAVWIGGALMAIAGVAVYWTIRDNVRDRGTSAALLLVALVLLALGPLLARRLGMGAEQALASRYVTLGSLAPIGVYFCLLTLVRRRRAAKYLLAALALLFVAGTYDGYSKGIAEGRDDRDYDRACIDVVRHFRQVDPRDLECAYPDPKVVLQRAPYLEQRHLSLFR